MSDDEKKTVELPSVPDWAVKLTEKVVGGFTAVNIRLDGLEGTDRRLADEVNSMGIDLKDLRAADRRHEDDIRRLSERTKDTSLTASQNDLEAAAQLAQERAARETLDAKVDSLTATQETQLAILGRLDRVAKNPLVKTLAAMLATALITWLASHGVTVK